MKIFPTDAALHAEQIITLQQENLVNLVPDAEKQSQGFVTAQHDFETLYQMLQESPSIVAMEGETLAGYILSMTPNFRNAIPILVPFFEFIEALHHQNKPIKNQNYMVVGQTCVAKAFRGTGLFRKMYAEYAQLHQQFYDFAITEIATANVRSLAAHQKLGFEELEQYTAKDGVRWSVVVWDFNLKA